MASLTAIPIRARTIIIVGPPTPIRSMLATQRLPSLPVRGLNHVSRVCQDVEASEAFYCTLLGFCPIRRPRFDFAGAWQVLACLCTEAGRFAACWPREIHWRVERLAAVCTAGPLTGTP